MTLKQVSSQTKNRLLTQVFNNLVHLKPTTEKLFDNCTAVIKNIIQDLSVKKILFLYTVVKKIQAYPNCYKNIHLDLVC